METEQFRQECYKMIDWIIDYYQRIDQFPVKSTVKPREVFNSLPATAPEQGEDFREIMNDFNIKLAKGITHWQHPSFFAYFNANTSYPSLLGELLTSAIGAQCMSWETSPAAAELEEKVCCWVKYAFGLPESWEGVIQDTASTATLCALLMARERYTGYGINMHGFSGQPVFTIYCSTEAHSSIEKDVKIAGFGSAYLRKVPVDGAFAMIPEDLEKIIQEDLGNGFVPLCVVAAVGTTGSHAIDPLRAIGEICRKYHIFYHVDAAHAGNATILPECRWLIDGLELADSYVFNPHKWMFTNFDCSLFFVRDKENLIRTFEILPEYLKTGHDAVVNNYRDWGIQLGRRFRALKLWFVLRSYGLQGIREKFRLHIQLAGYFAEQLKNDGRFEIMAPYPLNLVCFRYISDHSNLDDTNAQLLHRLNASGKVYLTHTRLINNYTLRVCIGQTNVEKKHVDALLQRVKEEATHLKR